MKKLKITGAVILLLAGLVMIFNEQIKCVIVDWMTNSSLKQPVKDDDSKGNFDFEKVKAVDNKMVAKAAFQKIRMRSASCQFQASRSSSRFSRD